MPSQGQLRQAASFATALYRQRLVTAYHGYVHRDPMSLLMLAPARENPYPIYERLRADGPISRTPLGNWVTTSHGICNRVLRDRRFGVRAEGEPADTGSPRLVPARRITSFGSRSGLGRVSRATPLGRR